ncbi:hypothetical protein, partial [Heyndrickxia ginsengihumi]|uniref:hypothetical protein n=1 Tax=Heyndrickxia ginsengihumi TaxID=363870 RepID=UPI003D200614
MNSIEQIKIENTRKKTFLLFITLLIALVAASIETLFTKTIGASILFIIEAILIILPSFFLPSFFFLLFLFSPSSSSSSF